MDITPYAVEFCRLFIFATLLFSSLGKGFTFGKFKDNLTESLRVPKQWTGVVTALIITVEGLLAVAIFMNNDLTYLTMFGALILFVAFTLFISVTVIQDRLVRCNCFGQNEEYISYLDIIRNVVLLLACGYYLYSYQPVALTKPIQVLLFGLAFIAYLIITNLKNIATIARDPKGT